MRRTVRPSPPTILIALALLAAGCGADATLSPSPSGGGERVSLLLFGEPEELAAYRELVETYESRHTGVDIGIIEASDRTDLLARLSTSFAGGQPPDLFLINYRYFAQFAARGVLEPMSSRLDGSAALDEEDFFAEAMNAFQFGGEQVCMPQNISSLVVYYNRNLFEASDVPIPAEGWTWDEMVDRAVALTNVGIDQYGLGVEPTMIRVAPFVWSNGAELFDDPARPTRFTLDDPEALAALVRFLGLGRGVSPIPSEVAVEAEDLESRFLNGRLAMLLSSRRSTPTFRTITDFEWDVAALPILEQPAGILHSDAYCMTAASESKDEAWRFVEFALGPDGQRITARSGRTVPSLVEVANSDAFLDPNASPANSRVFVDTIPYIRQVPSLSTWPEIEDVADPILELGLYGGLPADEVARQIDAATRELFARAEY